MILNIKEHFKNNNRGNEISALCDKIISKEDWEALICEA